RSGRTLDLDQRGRGVPGVRHAAPGADPAPRPGAGRAPARGQGARDRQHAPQGRGGRGLRARGRRAGGHRSTGARPRRPEREGGHDARQGRAVNLYEHQAREILRRHGIPVPDCDVSTTPDESLGLALTLYRDVAQARAAADIMQRLYTAFYAVGASLAEINPLATTPDGKVMALDAKIVVDDNELERRPEIAALRDPEAEAASEV